MLRFAEVEHCGALREPQREKADAADGCEQWIGCRADTVEPNALDGLHEQVLLATHLDHPATGIENGNTFRRRIRLYGAFERIDLECVADDGVECSVRSLDVEQCVRRLPIGREIAKHLLQETVCIRGGVIGELFHRIGHHGEIRGAARQRVLLIAEITDVIRQAHGGLGVAFDHGLRGECVLDFVCCRDRSPNEVVIDRRHGRGSRLRLARFIRL